MREKFIGQKPIEMRPVKFHNPLKGSVEEPHRYVWFRANGSMPDDQRIHQYLLGYASDFNFLPTALQPHGVGFLEPGMQVATIDHSMWFHRPFRMDDWLLYAVELLRLRRTGLCTRPDLHPRRRTGRHHRAGRGDSPARRLIRSIPQHKERGDVSIAPFGFIIILVFSALPCFESYWL